MKLPLILALAGLASAALSAQTLHLSYTNDQDDPLVRPYMRRAKAAFASLGLDLEVRAYPSERALRQANDGSLDGDIARFAGVISSKDYPNLVMVPEPLYIARVTAYSRTGIVIASVEDIVKNGYKVITLRGSKWIEAKIEPRLPADHYLPAIDVETATRLFEAGNADLLIVINTMMPLILARPEYADIKPAGVLHSAPLYTYLNKKWADIVPKLAEAYKKAKAAEAKN